MSEITIYTGEMDDEVTIHIDWFDHNNLKYQTDVRVSMLNLDKPRTLQIDIDNCPVYMSKAGTACFL